MLMKRFVLMLFSVAALSARPCESGLSVPTDSVISFSYDARNMTILLDGREVPYYFVFDTISGNRIMCRSAVRWTRRSR